jgi:hypothetical protein
MRQKHTPGPWHTGEGNGQGSIFKTAEGRMRFEAGRGTVLYPICTMVTGWKAEEDEANATLIAAAPDLLAALRRLLADCGVSVDVPESILNNDTPNTRAAFAAIAKAEGRH